MKVKVTNRQIKENYNNIISIGYCSAWYLLKGQEPIYYNCGVYGWNWDGYNIDNNTIIITGYRSLNGNIKLKSGLITKYNEKARTIWNNENNYEKAKNKVNKLLQKFVNEVIGE